MAERWHEQCQAVGLMNTENKNQNVSEAKAEEETTAIKLGLDVHAQQITVCRQVERLGPQPAQKMSWEKALKGIEKQVRSGAKVHRCYEAGPLWIRASPHAGGHGSGKSRRAIPALRNDGGASAPIENHGRDASP